MPMPTSPISRIAETQAYIKAIINRPEGGRRVSSIKDELGDT